MATETDHNYCEWSRSELSTDRSDFQATSISQLLDHGSISFGRFSIESLSWEKWSVFSHNRCREELEKFKAPGLVAQKKAYFEEYYGRIRNMKALQVGQEASLESDPCQDGLYCTQTGEDEQTTVQPRHSVDVTTTKEGEVNSGKGPQTLLSEIESTEFHQDSLQGISIDERKEVNMQQRSDYENIEDRETVRNELNVAMPISKLKVPAEETASESKVAASRQSEVALKNNLVSNKVTRNVNKQDDHHPVSKAKEAAASARLKAKLDTRTNSDAVKSLEGLRNRLHKANTVKAENGIVSRKATTNKATSTIRSTLVSSHRPLSEVRPNATVSRPLINVASTRIQDGAAKKHLNSKASTVNSLSSLPVHARVQSCNEGMSKDRYGGVKNIISEKKMVCEGMSKSPKLVSQCTIPKEKDAEEQRPKSMSTKDPVQSNSNKNNVFMFDHRSDVKGKHKEGKVGTTVMRSLHQSQATKFGDKTASSCSASLTLDGRKLRKKQVPSWR